MMMMMIVVGAVGMIVIVKGVKRVVVETKDVNTTTRTLKAVVI
jgi:Na+/melibiose symporter-like transporter